MYVPPTDETWRAVAPMPGGVQRQEVAIESPAVGDYGSDYGFGGVQAVSAISPSANPK